MDPIREFTALPRLTSRSFNTLRQLDALRENLLHAIFLVPAKCPAQGSFYQPSCDDMPSIDSYHDQSARQHHFAGKHCRLNQ